MLYHALLVMLTPPFHSVSFPGFYLLIFKSCSVIIIVVIAIVIVISS